MGELLGEKPEAQGARLFLFRLQGAGVQRLKRFLWG